MKKARTLQDIKDHPAVRFVDKEGNGYWIYLKDGWYNSQLEGLLIHEPTVKACCEILNQYVTESTESTEDATEATESTTQATEATTTQIVDTNGNLCSEQRQWMIDQIIDSMIETDSIETEDQEKKERGSLSKFSDSDLIFEYAGWNPGAIVND